MKKILPVLLVFAFLTFVFPVRAVGFFEKIFEGLEEKEDYIIFSDAAYTKPTHIFSAGQMVYVRIESSIGGDKEKILRLLDSEKKEIKRVNLNRAGNIFTTSFSAPNTPGVYYVDIKIEDSSGSKFASQENINVGEASGTTSVSAEAKTTVETTISPKISPTISVIPATPTPIFLKPVSISFLSQIVEFFRNLFSQLTNWFK